MIPLPWPDALSQIMIALGCFLLLPVLFCGGTPFRGGRTYLILGLFCVASCLAPLASSWFGFVLWMELASIALVLLVAFRDPFAARLYLYVQLAAGGILLLGAARISTLPLLAPLGGVPSKEARQSLLPSFSFPVSMILLAFPLLFLGISPENTLLLSFASGISWSWSSLGRSLLLLGGVLGFFLLGLRRIPNFQGCSFPDVDLLVYRLPPLWEPGLQRLRKIHSGKLRLSFTIFGFALLGIFLLFSL